MTSSVSLVLGAIALVVSPFVARALGADGRGRLVSIQLVPQFLADLSSVGLGFSIIHFGARRASSMGALLRRTLLPAAIGSAVAVAVGQLLAGPITSGFPADERVFRWYVALLCPLTAFGSIAMESFRGGGDYAAWNRIVFARGVIWFVALLVGTFVFDHSLQAIFAIHISLSATLFTWTYVAARRRFREGTEPEVTTSEFVQYGITSAVSTIPRSANAKLDQILMTGLVDRGTLGLYSTAVGWSAITVPVLRGLSTVTMPHLSASQDAATLRSRTRTIVSAGLFATVLLSLAGMAVTAVAWGPIYGSEYEAAATAALVLVPAALTLELNAILGNALRSLGRPRTVAWVEVAVMALSIGALLAVVRGAPLMGPAIVSLASYALGAVAYVVLIGRSLGVAASSLLWSKPSPIQALRRRRA